MSNQNLILHRGAMKLREGKWSGLGAPPLKTDRAGITPYLLSEICFQESCFLRLHQSLLRPLSLVLTLSEPLP